MAAEEVVVEAIHRAAREGAVDMVAGMLEEDPRLLSLMYDGDTLLTTAAVCGHVALVRLLLDRGAEINQANEYGATALNAAVRRDHEELVSILLTSGADPSRKSHRGQTALMHASSCGQMAVAQLLLRCLGGVGLDERTENGRTALWYACFYGHADVVRALLLAGADHTIADNDDTTPLQTAEQGEHNECVGVIQVSTSLVAHFKLSS
jgi:ankyrin repeat protein